MEELKQNNAKGIPLGRLVMAIENISIQTAAKAPSEDELSSNIKLRLKILREQHGYTQGDIATLVGKGRSTISAWERTDETTGPVFKPALRDLYILSDFYNLTIDELIGKPPIPDPRYGVLIHKNDFFFFNGRPITFKDENGNNQWGLVNAEKECLFLSDGSTLAFEDIPSDETFSYISNDVYKDEALYPDPLTLEDLKAHISTTDEKMKVWVCVKLENGELGHSPIDGYYDVIETGVDRGGIKMDFDTYMKKWVAFTDEPKLQ